MRLSKYLVIYNGFIYFKIFLKCSLNLLLILFLFTIRVIFFLSSSIAWQFGKGEYLLSFPLMFSNQAKFSGAVISNLFIFLFFKILETRFNLFL